jgi:hypothetical protein
MPKGPRGEKRPADVIGAAVLVGRIATGELADEIDSPKNPHAVALGRLGGQKGGVARASALSGAKRSEIAGKGAKARWGKKRRKT